jgi:hypothetical protein
MLLLFNLPPKDNWNLESVTVATGTATEVTLTSRRTRSLDTTERTKEHLGAVFFTACYEASVVILCALINCRTKLVVPGVRSTEMTLVFHSPLQLSGYIFSSPLPPRAEHLLRRRLNNRGIPGF